MKPVNEITQRDYWTEVKECAEMIEKETDDRVQPASEIIHETVDNHQWIIYTAYHTMILNYTDNLEAVENHGIGLDHLGTIREKLQVIAFYAFQADVKMKLYND
jgi:hypothetical protein